MRTAATASSAFKRIYFTQPEKFRATGIGATDFEHLSVAHGLSLMLITAKEASDRQWRAS